MMIGIVLYTLDHALVILFRLIFNMSTHGNIVIDIPKKNAPRNAKLQNLYQHILKSKYPQSHSIPNSKMGILTSQYK